MGLVINGKVVEVPGVKVISFLDDKSLKLGSDDCRKRQFDGPHPWVRSIILHTTMGDLPMAFVPGAGPGGGAKGTVAAQKADTSTHAGEHLIVDADGTVYCLADLYLETTFHATSVNDVSIGIEFKQVRVNGWWTNYGIQAENGVKVIDAITRSMPDENGAIQRQYHWPYLGEASPVWRLAQGGHDCVGIFGHRDQAWSYVQKTMLRGPGDPGDFMFDALHQAGYEGMNFEKRVDIDMWIPRQRDLGIKDCDGIPGPATSRALLAAGRKHGLLTSRPGD
jgi:hypothetical protein